MIITPVDICFLVIVIVFAVAALMKGFVEELFSKISVIGGLAVAIFFAPKLDVYVNQTISNSALSISFSFFLIFIVVFLTLSIIRHFVKKVFEGEIMKGLDKTLGFLLGIAEGLVVVIFVIAVLKIQKFYDFSEIFKDSLFYRFLGNVFSFSDFKGMPV